MRSIQIVLNLFFVSLVHCSPQFKKHVDLDVEARQAPGSFFAITGATGGTYPRLEIRDLEKSGEMWNLYLLAMTDFQAMDQNDIVSWYQIAGIHGMPWTSWDGVTGSTDGKDVSNRGYCPHSQLLFGTWHRPYLALFEQQLQSIATKIANQFPSTSRTTYQDAATKLRIPFWDWAKTVPTSQPVLPTAVTIEKVQVTFPNGSVAQIDNPLFDYKFHPLDNTQINGTGCPLSPTQNGPVGGLPAVCQNSTRTIRDGEKVSDNADLDRKYRRILDGQRSAVFKMLSQWQSFNAFSNNGNCGLSGGPGTLEAAHNPIHTNAWPGHFSPAAVSAFDPIFWMHHANVDRQMAIWQAIFPDSYVEPCEADSPTYTIQIGELLTADSPLTPFHKTTAGDWWTSANSRDISKMGYTYPELSNNPSNATLVASIKAQYSGPSIESSTQTKREQNATHKAEKYLAQIKLPLYGLKGSPYNVLIFLGDVSNNSKDWLDSDSFVGMTSTLGGVDMGSKQASIETIDLDAAFARKVKSGVTSNDQVEEYLRQNLQWRLELGENEIAKTEVADLEITLISTEVEFATSDGIFDRWVGGFKDHGKIDTNY